MASFRAPVAALRAVARVFFTTRRASFSTRCSRRVARLRAVGWILRVERRLVVFFFAVDFFLAADFFLVAVFFYFALGIPSEADELWFPAAAAANGAALGLVAWWYARKTAEA